MTIDRVSIPLNTIKCHEFEERLQDYILTKLSTCRYCPACESSSIDAIYHPIANLLACELGPGVIEASNLDRKNGYFVVYCRDCGRKLEKTLPAGNEYEIHESISNMFHSWNDLPPE